MTKDELIKKAESVLNRKTVGGRVHGDVGAALLTESRNVYTGVCVDTPSWGLCAERSAIAAMITAGEYRIEMIVAVWKQDESVDPSAPLLVLPPCGHCRQFILEVDPGNADTHVIVTRDKIVKLKELLPFHEWPETASVQA